MRCARTVLVDESPVGILECIHQERFMALVRLAGVGYFIEKH
jgi:hypothetical protein